MVIREKMTVEAFDAFVEGQAHTDKRYEFITGEIVELPSNAFVSEIAAHIIFLIKLFLHNNNLRGHVTGEAGGYQIGTERYAPDVAYLSIERQETLSKNGYNPTPPDLAVEIVSSGDRDELDQLRIKITNYLAVGTVVWVVLPEQKRVEIHSPGQPVAICNAGEIVDGKAIIPGLTLAVDDMFDVESL